MFEFILGVAVGGAAIWFGKPYVEAVIAWFKAKF